LNYSKRLIEFDLPIRQLSSLKGKRSVRNDIDVKSAGIWWSRKPQNQCRSIWLATILPDPDDASFDSSIRSSLTNLLRDYGFLKAPNGSPDLRGSLVSLCEYFAEPQAVADENGTRFIDQLMTTIGANDLFALDPFSGSGAIPVEAARLGLNVIAGEYNPLAWLNLTFLLSDWAHLTPEKARQAGSELKKLVADAQSDVAAFFPRGTQSEQPFGYIRFRLLKCEGPGCGKEIPATSKFQLNARDNIGIALTPDNDGFLLHVQGGKGATFPSATVKAGSVTCPACGYTTKRSDVMKQRGRYNLGTVIAAVVHKRDGTIALSATESEQIKADLAAAANAEPGGSRYAIPNERWPDTELRRFSPPLYGYERFADCHTPRQRCYLGALSRRVALLGDPVVRRVGALLLSRAVDANTAFCRWRSDRGGSVENTFAGKSIGMIWDFFESDPLHPEHDLSLEVDHLLEALHSAAHQLRKPATVIRGAAQQLPLPDSSIDVIYTDPPYYDSIPYSHLSDWPFVWVKQTEVFQEGIAANGLVERDREIVVDRPHSKSSSTHDEVYFRGEIAKAFQECRRVLKPSGVAVVVFAHLNTSAWEALLEAIVAAGFQITASWPVETERGGRLQAQGTASLQSSIHLVCRPHEFPDTESSSHVGEWRTVLAQLPQRIHEWMPRLKDEGIVGADAIFACLGPALEVFSRHGRVERASGEAVTLREYLEHVWAAISTEALSMIFRDADAAGLESDARFTAIVLWTLGAGAGSSPSGDGEAEEDDVEDSEEDSQKGTATKGGYTLEYDAARKIAQGLGVNLEQIDSVVEVKGDKARLRPVGERAATLFVKVEKAEAATKKRGKATTQRKLFDKDNQEGSGKTEVVLIGEGAAATPGITALDRVHQAMLLFAGGRADALKRFIVEDGVGGDARFWTLAQSLSALYPAGSEEKRWVDGVLARKKTLGF
jgi:putative DNA methylase